MIVKRLRAELDLSYLQFFGLQLWGCGSKLCTSGAAGILCNPVCIC